MSEFLYRDMWNEDKDIEHYKILFQSYLYKLYKTSWHAPHLSILTFNFTWIIFYFYICLNKNIKNIKEKIMKNKRHEEERKEREIISDII